LRQKIIHSKNYNRIKLLKKQRNKIVHQIKYRMKKAFIKWADYLINEIEKNKNNKNSF
jgi:hypothetical protein